jgi:lysyl-tRNA synthetase, class II
MIDFTPPFKRISMLDGLKEAIGLELPGGATNMGSPETNQYLLDMCAKHEVICTPPTTTARHACCLERVCPRR